MNTLADFNELVLQCQDNAYSLAWYLLGDEREAEAVTQAAVQAAYPCFAAKRDGCRLMVLQQVAKRCLGRLPGAVGVPSLQVLPEPERLAVVLVDILGLGYADAARVSDRPVSQVARLLARARRRLGIIRP